MAANFAKTRDGIRRLNTKVWNDNGHFSVKLYATVVYDETRDHIILAHSGWVTPTTASRINQALAHRGVGGHVNIKNGALLYNGKPFTNGEYVIDRV
jgi:hypothetical protein